MNKVFEIGRLTKDIELRYSTGANQTAVARFTLAVDRIGKDKGADFIGCVAFGKTAELMDRYLSKGSKVAVEGHIQTGSYEKDGRKVYTTDVIVDRVEFLSSQPKTEPQNEPQTEPQDEYQGFTALSDEEIEF